MKSLYLTLIVLVLAQSSLSFNHRGQHSVQPRTRRTSMMATQEEIVENVMNAKKEKKLADQIQDAGGFRNYLVDELMKDRTEDGDVQPKDPGLEQPLVLSPAAKERLRKSEELNAAVVKATRSAGIIIVGSCLVLLYLAKESGLTQ